MHASFSLLILLGAMAPLTHGYLHSLHQAAQQPSWRSLISMGPDVPSSRLDHHLVRCGAQMTGPMAPAASDKFTTLRTQDLAVAQNALIARCARGSRIASSGIGIGHVERHGGVFVQLCNLTDRPIRCRQDEVTELFEAMQCGSRDAPQMGLGATVSDAASLTAAHWVLVMGPRGAEAPCRSMAASPEEVWFSSSDNTKEL